MFSKLFSRRPRVYARELHAAWPRASARISAARAVYDFTLLPRRCIVKMYYGRGYVYRARFNILSAFNRTGIRVATTGGPINRHAGAVPVAGLPLPFADISGSRICVISSPLRHSCFFLPPPLSPKTLINVAPRFHPRTMRAR